MDRAPTSALFERLPARETGPIRLPPYLEEVNVRSRAFLTAAATVAAALTSVLGAAAASAATPTPAAPPALPVGPGPVPGPVLDDSLNVLDNVCVAPWRLLGPLSQNTAPTPYRVCSHDRVGGDGGVHILDNVCVAPIQVSGPLAPGGPAPYAACDDETTAGGPRLGSVSALRNLSVLGASVTH